MRLFLDTEFTSLEQPRLLALALCGERDAGTPVSCCVQWEPGCAAAQELHRTSNAFVVEHVWPALELRQASCVASENAFGHAVGTWLEQQLAHMGAGASLEVAYDYHTDFDLLEALLRVSGRWDALLQRLTPVHVGYLLGDADAQAAMSAAWAEADQVKGLRRHHPLADARALQAAFRTVHGQD